MKRILLTLWLFSLSSLAQFNFGLADNGLNKDTVAKLVSDHTQVKKGEVFYLHLSLQHPKNWYSYYYNFTTDFTIRPELVITPIEGVTIGETQYPMPSVKTSDGIDDYIYKEPYSIRVPITITEKFIGDTLSLKANGSWQICKESCLPPESTDLSINIPIQDTSIKSESADTLANGFQEKTLTVKAYSNGETLTLLFSENLEAPKFYDFDGQLPNSATPTLVSNGEGSTLTYTLTKPLEEEMLRGLISTKTFIGWIDSNIGSEELSALSEDKTPKNEITTSTTNITFPSDSELVKLYDPNVPILKGGTTLWYALFGAFLGGALLNLMPCVFPVLSLKVLSFVEKAGEKAWKVRLHGILFTAGVIISMWVLAVALFLVKIKTGTAINWGQQMSYPLVVGGIIVVLFLFGLNMAGIFEVGTKLASLGGNSKVKNGYVATLLSGVLTTIIATPCTGPFLGAAMSYTLSQPIIISLILFTAFALGISFPYLILSFFPSLTAILPRPGAWMETLKVILSFGMFAAAAFFMQTFASLTGGAGLSFLIMALVVIGLAAYFYGHWSLPHLSKRVRFGLGMTLPLIVLSIGLFMGWSAATKYEPPIAQSSKKSGEVTWYDWKPGIVEFLRSEGYFVYVDYTADWCATCKVNKKVIFGNEEFVGSLDESKIAFVKADMTKRDPVITKDLARAKGRKSIPVNIIYSPSKHQIPDLLEGPIFIKDVKNSLNKIGYQ